MHHSYVVDNNVEMSGQSLGEWLMIHQMRE
jgi:hypothetical protein